MLLKFVYDLYDTCFFKLVAEAECDILHDPTNGNVTTSMGTSFESLATYTCNDGYVLSHTGKRVCLSSGEWSDAAPTCLSVGELYMCLYLGKNVPLN